MEKYKSKFEDTLEEVLEEEKLEEIAPDEREINEFSKAFSLIKSFVRYVPRSERKIVEKGLETLEYYTYEEYHNNQW